MAVDLHLPEVGGLQVCRRVIAAGVRAHVVIMTAADDPVIEQKALSLGAARFALKYWLGVDLLPAIAAALHGRRWISGS